MLRCLPRLREQNTCGMAGWHSRDMDESDNTTHKLAQFPSEYWLVWPLTWEDCCRKHQACLMRNRMSNTGQEHMMAIKRRPPPWRMVIKLYNDHVVWSFWKNHLSPSAASSLNWSRHSCLEDSEVEPGQPGRITQYSRMTHRFLGTRESSIRSWKEVW